MLAGAVLGSFLRDVFDEITIPGAATKTVLGGGDRKINPVGETTEGASHAFSPLSGVGGYILK